MSSTRIPLIDLGEAHRALRRELEAAMGEVIDASAFAGGPFVQRFEEDFATFLGARHAVGVGSGTEALWLSLLALGIGSGHEVITVANTFMATAEAISHAGATPVFVEIDPATSTLSPGALEQAITPRTRAIIPVHLYGHPADMDPILEIARRHRLAVVEDACQAHGARYHGHPAGTMGVTGCFSFYPGKNLGAMGDAGAIVTQDSALAAELRTLRDHGQSERYRHTRVGWNGRMDGLQAAVLQVKLRRLAEWNEARRRHAAVYRDLLADVPALWVPTASAGVDSAWHLFSVRVPQRDAILASMAEEGIACGIHYPVPIHLQQAYRPLGLGPGTLPITERLAGMVLSLPLYPELTRAQIERVVMVLSEQVRRRVPRGEPALPLPTSIPS